MQTRTNVLEQASNVSDISFIDEMKTTLTNMGFVEGDYSLIFVQDSCDVLFTEDALDRYMRGVDNVK